MRRCDHCRVSYKPLALGQIACSFRCARRLYERKEALELKQQLAEEIASAQVPVKVLS